MPRSDSPLEPSGWLSQLEREMHWLVLLGAMPPSRYDLEVLRGVEGVLDRLGRHLESPRRAAPESAPTGAGETDFDQDLWRLRLAALAVGTEPLARILLRLADLEARHRELHSGPAGAATVRRCEMEAELGCLLSGLREWSGSRDGRLLPAESSGRSPAG